MDATVEAAVVGAAATLIGVGGTVIVAVTSARNSRRTNQATIDAANANAQLTIDAANANAQLTLETGREAQYADRYSRALEQLGSDNPDVKIGGIYALEGLALDSPRNHPTVMEVLTAYIREHTKGRSQDDWYLPSDVQAALTVVGRRKTEHDIRPVDLSSTDLRGANLGHANLKGVWLMNAHLRRATLVAANLDEAKLRNADLRSAYFALTSLRAAELSDAQIDESTKFNVADLDGESWPTEVNAPEGWVSELDFHNQAQSRLRQS
jgi:hypothetical protein